MSPLQNAFGNLALDETLLNRFGGGKSAYAGTVAAAGDTSIVTPAAAGKRVQVYWLSFFPDSDNVSSNVVRVGFGTTAIATELYRSMAMAHWEMFTGAADESLIVSTATAEPVYVTVHYTEID